MFQQARAGAPSILFMDELDAIVGKRGQGSKQGGAHERVLTTLLNEMDGIGLRVDQVISNQKEREGETVSFFVFFFLHIEACMTSNGHCVADNILKCIFLNNNIWRFHWNGSRNWWYV